MYASYRLCGKISKKCSIRSKAITLTNTAILTVPAITLSGLSFRYGTEPSAASIFEFAVKVVASASGLSWGAVKLGTEIRRKRTKAVEEKLELEANIEPEPVEPEPVEPVAASIVASLRKRHARTG